MTLLDTARSASRWDETVARLPDGSAYQTSVWAEAKGTRTTARRVVVPGAGDAPAAVAQLLVRRLAPGTVAAYVPYGPVMAEDRLDDAGVAGEAVAAIEDEARRAGCSVVFIQPSRSDRVTVPVLESGGYRPSRFEVATSATLAVELGRPDEEIFNRMTKARRRNVRRSQRRGAVIEQGGADDLDLLYRLHEASARRQDFLPMSADYLQRQWSALGPPGHLRLFLARVDGTVRAAGTLLAFGAWAEFKLTGWDASDEARNAFVNEALNWAMMSWANANGFRWFDLGGLPRDLARQALVDGVDETIRGTASEFKHGWGGDVTVFPTTHEKVIRPLGHLTYRLPSRLLDNNGPGGRIVNWIRRT
jgi:lipid II:glycine glycyltransferase (peptidoglycan interpeptide bridge formation enzyme)